MFRLLAVTKVGLVSSLFRNAVHLNVCQSASILLKELEESARARSAKSETIS